MNPKLRNDSSVNVKNGNVTAEQGSTVTYAPETNIFQNKKVVIGTVVAVVALLIIGFLVFRGFSLDGGVPAGGHIGENDDRQLNARLTQFNRFVDRRHGKVFHRAFQIASDFHRAVTVCVRLDHRANSDVPADILPDFGNIVAYRREINLRIGSQIFFQNYIFFADSILYVRSLITDLRFHR